MDLVRPILRTQLCDLLGIDYPLLQAGMIPVAGPDLVAAVSNAGGLGILGGFSLTADELRAGIRAIRAMTDKPFGVNLLLPPELRWPLRADSLPDQTVQAVQAALNPMRKRLGLPERTDRPPEFPDLIPEAFQVILDERVPVFSVGLGNPGVEMVEACHRNGTKVIAMVTTVEDARAVEATGLDAVVAQGGEAGGHRSHFEKPATAQIGTIGTLVLVPDLVDAVRIPVIAAGGIADGRGLAAALALGASGVLMGTRFVATRESLAHEAHKRAILERTANGTALTDVLSGRFARALRNRLIDEYERMGAPVLPFPWHYFNNGDIRAAGAARNDPDYIALWAGQAVGLIHDLPGAADVVELTIREARALIERLPQFVQL